MHAPYHAALGDLMQAAQARHGRAVLVDWHSMPARATGANGPDVVLGDRHGTACATGLTRRLRALFEALGWRVALNRPYAGGYVLKRPGIRLLGGLAQGCGGFGDCHHNLRRGH